MNLVIDIGNSSVKVAVFKGWEMVFRTHLAAPFDENLLFLAKEWGVTDCAYSSVGAIPDNLEQTLSQISPRPLRVTGTTPSPLRSAYTSPETLGSDRLAAAVGAAQCLPACPLLVIDVGTCITFDYVSREGCYMGGNISPGLGMRLRSLHEHTAKLPLVSSEGEVNEWGTDTQSAILSGVVRGIDLEIEGYIRTFRHRHPDGRIFLTGGNAYRFASESEVERNNALVEIGLNAILEHLK